jgi:predicted phosphohydrolase
MRVVAISDTHGQHEQLDLPDGDLLIHSGDFCRWGVLDDVAEFMRWFAERPHRHKVMIAGNHDLAVEKLSADALALVPSNVVYLQDEGATIAGLRVWGSPWTPTFHDWAFMLPRGAPLREKWARIPEGLDILITHGPPYGHGDLAGHAPGRPRRAVGCLELLAAVRRARPRLHVFGHIHEGHGLTVSDEVGPTIFANACSCTFGHDGLNPPLVIDL